MTKTQTNLLAHWTYTSKEWDAFVDIEKANKREDNIYLGIGMIVLGTIGLLFLRNTSFLMSLSFAVPLGVLIPFLRMKFSYKHLQKGVENPEIQLSPEYLIVNQHKIELSNSQKRLKGLKIIDAKNNTKLLELDVQWLTRKGPTNDEFRILIPSDKIHEAEKLVQNF